MATTDSKSYEYNGICDVCGWKLKSYQLKRRWDGFMVCKHDWEPRHSLDFYKTKNDTHKLPFTRPDSNTDLTFDPAAGVNITAAEATTSYTYSIEGSTVHFIMEYLYPTSRLPGGFRLLGGGSFSLPVTSVSAGTISVRDSNGRNLRPTLNTISAASSIVSFGVGDTDILIPGSSVPYTVTITGRYGV